LDEAAEAIKTAKELAYADGRREALEEIADLCEADNRYARLADRIRKAILLGTLVL
jgi:hypothetical protein